MSQLTKKLHVYMNKKIDVINHCDYRRKFESKRSHHQWTLDAGLHLASTSAQCRWMTKFKAYTGAAYTARGRAWLASRVVELNVDSELTNYYSRMCLVTNIRVCTYVCFSILISIAIALNDEMTRVD